MIGRLCPHSDQIRWYAQSALNGFDDLTPDDAIENAKHDLRSLLAYLDRADDTVRVFLVETVESEIRNETVIDEGQSANKPNLKIARL